MNILDLPMKENDANAATIREYLKKLLSNLWNLGECFSGKRPFGNSCWEYELYQTLVDHGLITSIPNDYNELDLSSEETQKANNLIFEAIEALH